MSNVEITPSRDGSARNQYYGTFVASLIAIVGGVIVGWCSTCVDLLISDESPLPFGKITLEEASWVSSLMQLGAFCSPISMCFGFITNKFGRKWPLLFITIPLLMSTLLFWFAQNVYHLYASRLLGGLFILGAYVIPSLFLNEIASDRIRGSLVTVLALSEFIGFMMAFSLAAYFGFYAIPKFVIGMIVIFAILFGFLPESPVFLLKQNKIEDAEASICFYRNLRKKHDHRNLIELEITKLKSIFGDNNNQLENNHRRSMNWSSFTKKPAPKTIMIGFVLVILCACNGAIPIMTYITYIFKDVESNLSPNETAIIAGLIQVIGVGIAIQLVDRLGRKLLIILSSIGSILSLLVFGTYMMLKSWNFEVQAMNWIPLVSFSCLLFMTALGIQSLTFTIIPEIMPEQIKDTCAFSCSMFFWLLVFINIKIFPFLIETFALHGTVFLYAGICLIAMAFIITVMPETKGKSREEIMKSLE